jgi:hypothetical protein
MTIDRKTLFALVAAFAVGSWMSCGSSAPQPTPDRPVARWIAGMAKRLLWLALVAEKPPAESASQPRHVQGQELGADGFPLVDHSRGW